ncbi:uncharacterized protein AMSG_02823 [Thecamonas trahens ATCC 50062]|uniref:Uncharacterized protein n=1 Tax=Thecamonas trahens ATCC 50062 TaxID=461836 RepID=A0A0L0D2F1_THETB|nr:hypothetical protein AMSG_02823 [Thecamonas trahens ATCC 50062]KNC46371.1 hypothetical protein AMSG_02823 [Thecamonas trahens ATCC 50062]|eukprot:XP_013760664.1 hypothetical protein AMSG_02823 [Thecamonas trahens ATCC 50062]
MAHVVSFVAVALLAVAVAGAGGEPPQNLADAVASAWSGTVTQTMSKWTSTYTWATSDRVGATFQQFGKGRINIAQAQRAKPSGMYITCFGLPADNCYCDKAPVTYPGPLGFTTVTFADTAPSLMAYSGTTPDGYARYNYTWPAGSTVAMDVDLQAGGAPVALTWISALGATETYSMTDVVVGEPASDIFTRPCNHSSL